MTMPGGSALKQMYRDIFQAAFSLEHKDIDYEWIEEEIIRMGRDVQTTKVVGYIRDQVKSHRSDP